MGVVWATLAARLYAARSASVNDPEDRNSRFSAVFELDFKV